MLYRLSEGELVNQSLDLFKLVINFQN